MILYVHALDHETKRVSLLVIENARQGLGEKKWEVLLGSSGMDVSEFPPCSPGLGGVHTAQCKHCALAIAKWRLSQVFQPHMQNGFHVGQ